MRTQQNQCGVDAGYKIIANNELADQLAKRGSQMKFFELESGPGVGTVNGAINECTIKQHQKRVESK